MNIYVYTHTRVHVTGASPRTRLQSPRNAALQLSSRIPQSPRTSRPPEFHSPRTQSTFPQSPRTTPRTNLLKRMQSAGTPQGQLLGHGPLPGDRDQQPQGVLRLQLGEDECVRQLASPRLAAVCVCVCLCGEGGW